MLYRSYAPTLPLIVKRIRATKWQSKSGKKTFSLLTSMVLALIEVHILPLTDNVMYMKSIGVPVNFTCILIPRSFPQYQTVPCGVVQIYWCGWETTLIHNVHSYTLASTSSCTFLPCILFLRWSRTKPFPVKMNCKDPLVWLRNTLDTLVHSGV